MTRHFDIAIIGAGIAGASVAAKLANSGKTVVLLEMERQPGYHTTGRSAAIFSRTYGPKPIRALTCASEAFFLSPPDGFCDAPLLSQRAVLMIARADQEPALEKLTEDSHEVSEVVQLDEAGLRRVNPLIRPGYAQAAMLDTEGYDIDVAALHQGYLRQFKRLGGTLMTNFGVTAMDYGQEGWQLTSPVDVVVAQTVVNAAGAWADSIGALAGAEQIGLLPKRRTALIIPAPDTPDLNDGPLTVDVDEQFYLKPEAGRLLVSPADETPAQPCDAQPDEMDIAVCIDRIETAFDIQVRRIESKWAGLRSFVADKSPVAGFSNSAEDFFWLAGQGGYGIQSSPALADLAAAQILGQPIPDYLLKQGVDPADLSPHRLSADPE